MTYKLYSDITDKQVLDEFRDAVESFEDGEETEREFHLMEASIKGCELAGYHNALDSYTILRSKITRATDDLLHISRDIGEEESLGRLIKIHNFSDFVNHKFVSLLEENCSCKGLK